MSLACVLASGGADNVVAKDTNTRGVPRARRTDGTARLTPEDIEHLHKGYVGLLSLMERIPTHWAWAAEPPQVFRADE